MSKPHRVSSPDCLRVIYTAGMMNVYCNRMAGLKPFVVGHERFDRLTLLEEFDELKDAKKWAQENAEAL